MRRERYLLVFVVVFLQVLIVFPCTGVCAQQLAFPTAEGYGAYTTGGRGGSVIEVTNLDDSGPGSLREAISANGPRTVVFRVSGNISLKSRLSIKNGNITIAGQTAPGDGICLRDYDFIVSTDNVIIRYLRIRLGDINAVEADAFGGIGNSDVIIDHCTVSWSVDEAASFYDNTNFTMQWCLISESMKYSVHSKGAHGYGGIWGGMGASFHHNLLAHHDSRLPRFQGSRNESTPETEIVDHRNNVIYNWDGNSAYGGEAGNHNMIANYYKYGPATDSKRNRIVNPSDELGKWYVKDNYVVGYPIISADNWLGGVQGVDITKVRVYEPFPFIPVITHEAETAYQLVLDDVGASLARDSVDTRVIMETRTGTATYGGLTGAGTGIIDSQNDVGGWPELLTYNQIVDDDHDGMDDDWERANGLDPSDPEDRNGDFNGDGYSNLEKYLNQLCIRDDFLLAPAELHVETYSDTEINLYWQENSPNESGFLIERSEADTSDFSLIAVTGIDVNTYSDTGLLQSVKYFYRVRAYNDQGNSLYTNLAWTTTLDSTGLPQPVTNPKPADHATNINLTQDLQWDYAPGASQYELYIGISDSLEYITTQTETSYRSPGWQDNTTYYWRVDTKNEQGTTKGPLWQFSTISLIPVLVADWRMDRGYGSWAIDNSGNAIHATLLNMTDANWVTGIKGSPGLYFNGVNQYLYANHKAMIDFGYKSFTLLCWIRPTEKNKLMPIVSKMSDSPEYGRKGFQLWYDQGSVLKFEVTDSARASRIEVNTSQLAIGEWEYVAVVRDAGKHELRMYLNGELSGTALDSTGNISNTAGLYMAANYTNQHFYNGILDDIKLYENILPEESILSAYQEAVADLKSENDVTLPVAYSLSNYPNPFNNATIISYSLPKTGQVEIYIYNLLGEVIAKPVNQFKTAGNYTYHFDASGLASGIYLCRMNTGSKIKISKMILVK